MLIVTFSGLEGLGNVRIPTYLPTYLPTEKSTHPRTYMYKECGGLKSSGPFLNRRQNKTMRATFEMIPRDRETAKLEWLNGAWELYDLLENREGPDDGLDDCG